jgi:hypothetical protein
MYHNLGVEWAGTVVGFIALIFIPAPILFYKFGQRIRMSSKYAREADAAARVMAEKFQRAKLVGSVAASRVASGTDVSTPTATATLNDHILNGSSDVDVEKVAGTVEAPTADSRGMASEGASAFAMGARVGGEADAMALPAVEAVSEEKARG